MAPAISLFGGTVAALLLLQAAAIAVAPPRPRDGAALTRDLDDLVAAYPDHLAGHDGTAIAWRDGRRMPVGDPRPRSADAVLADPAIRDIQAWPYPLAGGATASGDPGRARPDALFTRMYGDCAAGAVERDLVPVRWIGGHRLRFTRINGAATALEAVARDLEALGPDAARYLWPTSGTYNCRAIAGTTGKSMHAYGAAIDLASRYGAYWRWGPRPTGDKTIPPAIIAAFERHGFIWGGKWAHYDSFHFEYRPEIIRAARRQGGR